MRKMKIEVAARACFTQFFFPKVAAGVFVLFCFRVSRFVLFAFKLCNKN